MLNIGFVTGSRRTCTDQLTGIHLSSGESFLSRDTWIDMVKHQICTRVDDWPVRHYLALDALAVGLPACTSLTREVFVNKSGKPG